MNKDSLILEDFGVRLKRLTNNKIEMVRQWRNDPKIQKYMEYREIITPEMQEKWFRRINNDNNYYFIIESNNIEIGLINIRDIDYTTKIGESGIFIWEDSFLHTGVSYRAGLCLNNFAFNNLGLIKLHAHILSDNPRSAKYFEKFGYKLQLNQNGIYNQLYILEKNNYLANQKEIINSL